MSCRRSCRVIESTPVIGEGYELEEYSIARDRVAVRFDDEIVGERGGNKTAHVFTILVVLDVDGIPGFGEVIAEGFVAVDAVFIEDRAVVKDRVEGRAADTAGKPVLEAGLELVQESRAVFGRLEDRGGDDAPIVAVVIGVVVDMTPELGVLGAAPLVHAHFEIDAQDVAGNLFVPGFEVLALVHVSAAGEGLEDFDDARLPLMPAFDLDGVAEGLRIRGVDEDFGLALGIGIEVGFGDAATLHGGKDFRAATEDAVHHPELVPVQFSDPGPDSKSVD